MIVIAGAGIIGLTTALRFIQRSDKAMQIVIVTRETTPNTTSDKAGALWRPFGEVSKENFSTFKRWGKDTFDALNSDRMMFGEKLTGIYLTSGYEVFPEKQETPYWASDVIGFRHVEESELRKVMPNYFKSPYGHPKHGFFYTSLIVDMALYMSFLHRRFFSLGGKVIIHNLKDLSEIPGLFPGKKIELVVNCTGLGSNKLTSAADNSGPNVMYPVSGQICRVRAPYIKQFFMDESTCTYIFPRANDVVCGGTYFKRPVSASESTFTPALETRFDILQRCSKFVPELGDLALSCHSAGAPNGPNGDLLGEYVGLRPYRTNPRLERDDTRPGLPIIHSYGHGGSGATLAWGCATDVVVLYQHPHSSSSTSHASKL